MATILIGWPPARRIAVRGRGRSRRAWSACALHLGAAAMGAGVVGGSATGAANGTDNGPAATLVAPAASSARDVPAARRTTVATAARKAAGRNNLPWSML